jgi:hypothetical protein
MPGAVQRRIDPHILRVAVAGTDQMDMTVPDLRQVQILQGARNGRMGGDTFG